MFWLPVKNKDKKWLECRIYIKFVVRVEKNACDIYRMLEHVTERKAGVKHGFVCDLMVSMQRGDFTGDKRFGHQELQ